MAVAFILSLVIVASGARARPSPDPQAQNRMARAVDRVLREGLHAQLPPHLSTLLGLTAEKECSVTQSLARTEESVQGFDVSTLNKDDVVIFVVNETTKDQTLYLTSAEGALRRVVSVKGGFGGVTRISAENRKAFEKEKQFWLNRLAPAGASK